MRISFELTRGGSADASGDAVEKAGERRPAGTVSTSLAREASALGSSTPAAAGAVPDPGPLPIAEEPPPSSSKEPVTTSPIRYQFPYAVNQTLTPRGEDRRLTPFQQLRALADACDIVRIAIEARKDQMTSLSWDFAPRERSHTRKMTTGETATIKRLRAFFRKPDKINAWNTWLRMLIEEVLVVDALSIYRRRTKGGGPYSLELVDGTTIKPLLGSRGYAPQPPHVAYRQIIHGQAVKGGDCTVEQLMYRPRTVRTWTPYGLSAAECVMLTVNTALNRQLFNLSYYSEGNIPEGLVSTPEGWTTDQIKQFQEYWDSVLTGNYAARKRLRFVGPKMAESVYQFKKESFDTKFDEWLLQVVCASFNVQPQELGFTQQINKSQGEQQENITYRRGVKPLGNFIKDIVDEVVADDLDADDFECIFTGGESEDRKNQAEIDRIYFEMGKVSVDELRARDGEEMIGLGPLIMTNEGPVFVEQLIKDKDHNPLTSNVRDIGVPETDLSKQNTDEAAKRKTGKVDDESADMPPAGDEIDDDDAETAKAVDAEMTTFRRFIMNRVTKGRSIDNAATLFESDVLPLELRERIVGAIVAKAASASSVASTFESIEKAAAPKRLRVQAQSRYRKFAKAYFADLADALSTHVGDGVTE